MKYLLLSLILTSCTLLDPPPHKYRVIISNGNTKWVEYCDELLNNGREIKCVVDGEVKYMWGLPNDFSVYVEKR